MTGDAVAGRGEARTGSAIAGRGEAQTGNAFAGTGDNITARGKVPKSKGTNKGYKHVPLMSSIPPPREEFRETIREMLSNDLGFDNPGAYQADAIFLVYRQIKFMYLIRKTGEGKSLVLQGMATALRGITVVLAVGMAPPVLVLSLVIRCYLGDARGYTLPAHIPTFPLEWGMRVFCAG